ncbi:MAG: tRNA pseudouridine(55) synthase TruB [Chitinophagaceae bacterium]
MEQTPNSFEQGQVLLLNKPLHWTSFDVVREVRNLLKVKKVGHAGTLDPLATGLLILCTGKFTKRINEFMTQEKEYTGTITLGAVTATYDLESEPTAIKKVDQVTEQQIIEASKKFIGKIMQVPPSFSAIKKDGKRMYDLARKGIEVVIEPRPITIKEFDISSIEMPIVSFRVVCTTGTYIRSLANDIGKELGCGGHLSSLCRTRIGAFTLEQSYTMDSLRAHVKGLHQKG